MTTYRTIEDIRMTCFLNNIEASQRKYFLDDSIKYRCHTNWWSMKLLPMKSSNVSNAR